MATRADIEINVKGLKKVQELSRQLDKVSSKVNSLNKRGAGSSANKNNRLEQQSLSIQEKKRASMVRVRSIGDQIQKAKEAGLKTDRASRALNRAVLANSKGKFKLAKASSDAALLELKALKEQSKELTQQKILRASRGGGSGGFRGGGRRDERSNRAALTSGAISGAFPLLFGQGPIGGLAGFAGGFAGTKIAGQMGGFAGGLVATAALQTVTNIVNGITDLGKALNTLDGSFNLLKEKSLFSSKEAAARAQVLQTLGEREKLATLVSKELTQVLGEDGAEKLREAGKASEEFNKEFTKLSLNLQIALAGPIKTFIELLNKVLDQGRAVSLGENMGTVNFGSAEDQFIKDFKGVLDTLNQSQIDRILRAPIGTNVEGLNVTNTRQQAIRKFNLVREVNPDSTFVGGSGTKSETGTAKELLEIDAARVATSQRKINSLQSELEFAERIRNVGFEEADILRQVDEITKNLNAEELKLLETGELNVRTLVEKNIEAKKLIENSRDIGSNFEKIGESIASGVSDNLTAAIQGTKTLGDAAKSILNDLSSTLIRLGVNTLLSKIPGFGGLPILGGKAKGGPVKAGGSFVVGEKGPELFVPKRSGTIIPNDKLGGGSTNISVNVDASGSSVQGDEQQSKELGRAISAAIQSELLKQKRPGGLLR